MIITPLLMMQALQIGSKVAAEVVDDPKVKNKLRIFNQIAQLSSLAGAFKSPSTGDGLKIADGKLGDLGESTGMINPKGFGAFEGALPEGISGAFGGKNTLPESLGGAFKSPGWNAPESIFNPPGEMKPFDWSLF